MDIERAPLLERLDARPVDDHHAATLGQVEVRVLMTNIGMNAGRAAGRRAVDLGADLVVVVGIAGGVRADQPIGSLIRPELVVDRASGWQGRPHPLDHHDPAGILSCGDDFLTEPGQLRSLAASGVVALDMESAAVGEVCESAGRAWSVVRALSDRPGDGLIDPEVLAFTAPDGHADPEGLAAYLAADPARASRLAELARDTQLATKAAADAAIAAIRAFA
jgi:nucleoside phosphorylase